MQDKIENYYLYPGYIYASQERLIISTVLGSCVSLCLWDRVNIFGGMNHFIFPQQEKGEKSTRYGDVACMHLLRLMKDLGSRKEDLVVHVVGGAQNTFLNSYIGNKNIEIVQKFLERFDLRPSTFDVGGEYGRKIAFNTATGEVIVYKCARLRGSDWHRQD